MRKRILSAFLLVLLISLSLLGSFPVFGEDDEEYSAYCNLNVNYFDAEASWTDYIGAVPYINASDYPDNYVKNTIQTDSWDSMGYFLFEWNSSISEINNITLSVRGARIYGFGFGYLVPLIRTYGVEWNLTNYGWDSSTLSYHNWTGIESYLNTPLKLQNSMLMLQHNITSNGGLQIDHAYYIVGYTYKPPTEYVYPLRLILGLLGLAIMIISPTIGVRELYKNKNYEMIGGCMALFCIGYALVLVWLIP